MLCTEIVFDIQNNLCTQHVLPKFCKNKSFWQRYTCTAIVLYENSAISDEILNDIKETLSQKASVSTFEMGSNPAQSLPSILASLPSRQLGKYFFL